MGDTRELLERTGERFPFPDHAFERLTRRRERKIRNRRVGAWIVAAALAGLSVVLAARALPDAKDRTGDPSPSVAPTIDLDLDGPRHGFVHLSSGEITRIPSVIDGGTFYPVSPDGTRFAVSQCCDPPGPGFVANVDGTGPRQVTPEGVDAFGLRWSPDGTSIVYQGRNAYTRQIGDIFLVDADRIARIRQITDLEQFDTRTWFLSPTFSADGRSILFHLPRWRDPGKWDLWTVPVTGGEPTRVRRNAAFGEYSIDGTLLYLSGLQPNFLGSGLWVLDGGEPRQLVEAPEIGWPRWSPDGTRIAYEQGGDVYVMDVASGRSILVTRGGRPEWLDTETLVFARAGVVRS
jgi:hypothetical protein